MMVIVMVMAGGLQHMAACCLAGTESRIGEAEAVSDAPPSGHCQEPADPHDPARLHPRSYRSRS